MSETAGWSTKPLAANALDADAMWSSWKEALQEMEGTAVGSPATAAQLDRWFGQLSTKQRQGHFTVAPTAPATLDPAGVFAWHMRVCQPCSRAGEIGRTCLRGRGLVGLAVHGVRKEAVQLPTADFPSQSGIKADDPDTAAFIDELVAKGVVRELQGAKACVAPVHVVQRS